MIPSKRCVQTSNNHRAPAMSEETRVADQLFGGMVLVELQYPKGIQLPACFSELLLDLQGVSKVYRNT